MNIPLINQYGIFVMPNGLLVALKFLVGRCNMSQRQCQAVLMMPVSADEEPDIGQLAHANVQDRLANLLLPVAVEKRISQLLLSLLYVKDVLVEVLLDLLAQLFKNLPLVVVLAQCL